MAAKAKKKTEQRPAERLRGIGARIKKGDRVIVITGRDKGRKGEILRMYLKDERALVSGVNMVKRHQKQSARVQGGIVNKEAPLHVSNLAHVDPKTGGPTRIGFKVLKDGRKVRFARKSGEVIDV
jgi:large subunit ribosomal protein L24